MLRRRTIILSAVMKWAIVLLIVCVAALCLYIGLSQDWIAETINKNYATLNAAAAPTGGALWAFRSVFWIQMIIWVTMLWQMYRLFDCFHRQAVFSNRMTSAVRGIGVWLIVAAVFSVIAGVANSLILTGQNAEGSRNIMITVNDRTFMLAAFGVMMLLMGLVMDEALRLDEENRQIV